MIKTNNTPVPISDSVQCSFWDRVDIRLPSECWKWMGTKNKIGYGDIRINGKYYTTSRISYFLSYGENIDGSLVLHTCDNPTCVNPFHLFTGTQKDNMEDMIRKGRKYKIKGRAWKEAHPDHSNHLLGSANSESKLTEEDVIEIRKKLLAKEKQSEIARQFGVSYSMICRISKGKNWLHVKEGK